MAYSEWGAADNPRVLVCVHGLTRLGRGELDVSIDFPHPLIGRQTGSYDITQYQTTHNTGGTIMGTDPSTSVVNRYLQSWDVSNVFVIGASNYPQNASYNPTGTLGALAYWAADAITTKYLKAPGPLMKA